MEQDNQSGNARSTNNAPITNEPELTANQGTQDINRAAQPQESNLDKRILGFDRSDETDGDGNFVGERGNGLQAKDPVAPTEMRNASAPELQTGDAQRAEEGSSEDLHNKFPATDIGPKVIPAYAPNKALDEAYAAKKDAALADFNNQNRSDETALPEMGEGNQSQTSAPVERKINE